MRRWREERLKVRRAGLPARGVKHSEPRQVDGCGEQREVLPDAQRAAHASAEASVLAPHEMSDLALDLGARRAVAPLPRRSALPSRERLSVWCLACTQTDLDELEAMLITSGLGGPEDMQKAKEESHGLGLFVRSLIGLDRGAAKQSFAGFLTGKKLAPNQIEFVDMIINHLTEHGVMDAALLYESPFTDLTPKGPDALFGAAQLDELLAVLHQVRAAALAA